MSALSSPAFPLFRVREQEQLPILKKVGGSNLPPGQEKPRVCICLFPSSGCFPNANGNNKLLLLAWEEEDIRRRPRTFDIDGERLSQNRLKFPGRRLIRERGENGRKQGQKNIIIGTPASPRVRDG